MTTGQLNNAIRRAHNLFDQWNSEHDGVKPHTSYYYELMGLVSDAVHCVAQAATGDFKPLDSEDDETPESITNKWAREREKEQRGAAVTRANELYEKWDKVTYALSGRSCEDGFYLLLLDAVQCGIQPADGERKRLPNEKAIHPIPPVS